MALNTTTLETSLNTKMNATTGTTEGKEFLLLGKAVEALTPTVTVSNVITEGTTQVARVTSEGTTQVAAVQAAGSGYASLTGATFTGDIDIAGEFIADSYNETFVTLTAAATVDVDCETGNVFALTTDQNTTFTLSNPPASGTSYGFTLKLTAGGTHTITWPTSVDWAGATAPDAPASGETNVLVFITHDGGTTWYGFQGGAAMA